VSRSTLLFQGEVAKLVARQLHLIIADFRLRHGTARSFAAQRPEFSAAQHLLDAQTRPDVRRVLRSTSIPIVTYLRFPDDWT
jgi:hypothetical protein